MLELFLNEKSRHLGKVRDLFTLTMLFLFALVASSFSVQVDDENGNEYRPTLALHHPIRGDLTGFGELGYRWNPEKNYQVLTVLAPGVNYRGTKWMQLSVGLRTVYTDNANSTDKLELRPFAGVKLFLPNNFKWHIFNYTR